MARPSARRFRMLVAAFALVFAAPAAAAPEKPKPMTSDAEIDAQLFSEIDGAPGVSELRRLTAGLEPKLWALAREIVRRSLEEREEGKRDALMQKFLAVEASARQRSMRTYATAPLAELDASAAVRSTIIEGLEQRDPALCMAYVWPDGATQTFPVEITLPLELSMLRASRAGRERPTQWPKLDGDVGKRLRPALHELGFSDAEIAIYNSSERPKDGDDRAICGVIRRVLAALPKLTDEVRGAWLASTMDRETPPDPFGADAERLARIPNLSDAELDAMLTSAPVRPGAAEMLKLVAESDAGRWPSVRSATRNLVRPIDDDDLASTMDAFAFSFSVGPLKAALSRAPLAELDGVVRAALDGLKALIRVKDGRLACTRIGEYWIYDGDAAFAAEKIPAEAGRFVEASAAAIRGAKARPVDRPAMDAEGYARIRTALAGAGYAEPGTGSKPGASIAGPTEAEGGWCGWKADYYEALLRLPDATRETALAFEMSRGDADP